MFMWPTPSLSQRVYANEMLMHWCILRFASKSCANMQSKPSHIYQQTEQCSRNSKYLMLDETCQCCQRVQKCVAEGDPSCPPKRVNLWHYLLSDMKRILKSGLVRLWMETGFCHCEQDLFRGRKENVRLRWNRAMFSFKWLFDFPMVPELASV